ncbi:MAG TPA: hypothetical protein VGK00_17070 [Anaerolineales bacterium]
MLMYEYMLNRWWPVTLLLALFVFLNVGALWGAEWYFARTADNPLPVLSGTGGMVMLAVGVISLVFTIFLLVTRKMAYVQLFDDHLRMVTPFLRMNISYKRVQRSTTAQLYNLFPPKSLSSWRRDLIAPVSGRTVVVVHLNSYPLPRASLSLFLSPFFFYDKTPHFVLLIDDWMSFSTELESRRSLGRNPRRQPAPSPRRGASSLLDDLNRK